MGCAGAGAHLARWHLHGSTEEGLRVSAKGGKRSMQIRALDAAELLHRPPLSMRVLEDLFVNFSCIAVGHRYSRWMNTQHDIQLR